MTESGVRPVNTKPKLLAAFTSAASSWRGNKNLMRGVREQQWGGSKNLYELWTVTFVFYFHIKILQRSVGWGTSTRTLKLCSEITAHKKTDGLQTWGGGLIHNVVVHLLGNGGVAHRHHGEELLDVSSRGLGNIGGTAQTDTGTGTAGRAGRDQVKTSHVISEPLFLGKDNHGAKRMRLHLHYHK